MFERFFKKKSLEESKQSLNELSELLRDKKYDEVILKASSLAANNDKEISLEASQKLALAYFRKGEYSKSLVPFEEIASSKNDVGSWFNVITAAVLNNDPDKGKQAFYKTIELQKASDYSQQPSMPQIRYYYACALNDIGLYSEALEQLDELKKIYMQLVITDDTFVYLRGVPFLSHTLDLAKKVMLGLNTEFSNSHWLKELKDAVDDDGKEIIKKYYE
jgi:tetratricopeptide (TPR) repeat protein